MPDHWALHHAQWEQSSEGRAAPLLVWESVDGSPGGWGDRLRGAMLAMRVASKHKRSLRLLFEGKHFLAPFLQPATFDWRLKPDVNDTEELLERNVNYKKKASIRLFDKQLANLLHKNATVVLDTRRRANVYLPITGAEKWNDSDGFCEWAVMFKPTQQLRDRAEAQLAKMGVNRPYTAVHLRMGGLVGERKTIGLGRNYGKCPEALSKAAVRCAQGVSKGMAWSSHPTLVVVDNEDVRAHIAAGKLAGAVGPSYGAVHVSLARHDVTWDSWVDLYMLSQAECLVMSRSGFSSIAAWWRHKDVCTASMKACLKADNAFHAECKAENLVGGGPSKGKRKGKGKGKGNKAKG
jgi:hypothetical protein